MAFGENDSQTTSAHFTRSRITSLDSGFDISNARPIFPAFIFWYRPPLSAPPSSLRNGWIVRAVSTLFEDSIRTTVAPQSARTLVDAGPAMTHCKSSTFTSDRGNAVPSEADLAVFGGKSRAISPSNSAFASPRAGGGWSITIGVADIFAEGPGNETVPWSGISISRQKSRSA